MSDKENVMCFTEKEIRKQIAEWITNHSTRDKDQNVVIDGYEFDKLEKSS